VADYSKTLGRFQEIASRSEREINLAEAALLIAAGEYPNLEPSIYLNKLDGFAAAVRERVAPTASPLEKISATNAVLFGELGFGGNRENYYDARNSFLNEVIDRRTGIPITLSIIYMEVAARVCLSLSGVGMPAHFLVKYSGRDSKVFIDPFNAGRVLTESECAELLAEMSGGRIEFRHKYLAPVTKKQILTRMLANLQGIYARGGDYGRALRVINHSIALNPDSAAQSNDRARMLMALGRRADALQEFERCLTLTGESNDRDAISEQINAIRRYQARLN
jgi:regulator of sirC expression with transglutaminase-like and TPR domain